MLKENSGFGKIDWRSIRSSILCGFLAFCTFYTANTEIAEGVLIYFNLDKAIISGITVGLARLSKKALTDYSKK